MTRSRTIARSKQPGLFSFENVLTQRFGREFFAALPEQPGVYFFSDDSGKLLYIGQSASLKTRVGSYRHVVQGRHPKRTLRLVSRIRDIRWELCDTPAAAITRESELLLEHRPPFNRAGVWIGEPWWLAGGAVSGRVLLQLQRESSGIGPLPPSFRHVFGALARCIYRVAAPDAPLHRYPCGLLKPSVPLSLSLALPDTDRSWRLFMDGAGGAMEKLLGDFDALAVPTSLQEAEFWADQRKQLASYPGKVQRGLGVPSGRRVAGAKCLELPLTAGFPAGEKGSPPHMPGR